MASAASYTSKLFGMEGKCVLVTGGTSGIGKAVVEEFAKLGAKVYTCARDERKLSQTVANLSDKGHVVGGSPADVCNLEDAKDLVAKAMTFFDGRLDVLINNVGTNLRKAALDATAEDLAFLMATNVQSALQLSQLCHPALAKAGGSIVLNSSVASGPQAMKSGCMYAMTKASLNQLTKNLACEWARDGIRVNAAAAALHADPQYEAVVLGRMPLGRIGHPAEIAAVMAFLASPAAAYMTGQTLAVDGGHSVMGIYAEAQGDAASSGARF